MTSRPACTRRRPLDRAALAGALLGEALVFGTLIFQSLAAGEVDDAVIWGAVTLCLMIATVLPFAGAFSKR